MTTLQSKKAFVVGIFCILLIASCGKKTIDRPCSHVADLVGKAVIVLPNHEFKDAFTGMPIPVGSKITVAPASRIIISVRGAKSVAAPENTVFCIDSLINANAQSPLSARLYDGKLFCMVPSCLTIEAMPFPMHIRMLEQNASLLVRCGKDARVTVVKTLGAAASIEFTSGKTSSVPSCCKALITGEGALSRPLPLNEKDFSDIESITGKPAADSVINSAACPQTMPAEPIAPPQWIKSPNAVCMVGRTFLDTIAAKDPQGSQVRYRLLSGPKNMTVDSVTGVLRFTPKKAGAYALSVAAVDSMNVAANLTYELSAFAEQKKAASRKPYAVISVPGVATPGEAVAFDASRSASASIPPQSLLFRFDVNGVLIGDCRSGDGFGRQSKVTHSFETEGTYTVHLQVKESKGETAFAQSAILIRTKPVAAIIVSPREIFVNKECVLDAGRSIVGKSVSPFKVRWDFDNNGSWDFPPNGGYTDDKIAKKIWSTAGIYSVVLEIKDKTGRLAWASAEIEVKAAVQPASAAKSDTAAGPPRTPAASINPARAAQPPKAEVKPAIVKAGGTYQARACKPVTLEGFASAPDKTILSYAWDFDGDGAYDTAFSTIGKTVHTYCKAGAIKAVLKVTTADKREWFDTATVIVRDTPPIAHAGRHFFSKKGRTVTLKGSGEDFDDGIALYEWDFDNDGVFDWSSPKSGEVKHRFEAYATAVLRVTDRNGAAGSDSVRVVICPEGMVEVEQGTFCIDKYEWPDKKGQIPDRDISYEEAVKKCADAGEHLCSGAEWRQACAGKHNRQYPKSNAPPEQNCNVIGNHSFPNKVAPAGSFSDCESPAGAYDMNGNVAEWTAAPSGDSAYVYGGSWHNDRINATCSSKLLLKKNMGYFYVGFRCCK